MAMANVKKFISRNSSKLTQNVSLEILAREHKKTYNCIPILVVDGLNILRPIFRDLSHTHCGGQWTEYVHRLKRFVETIRIIGIEMVFYFDGSFKDMSKEELESRERNDGMKMTRLFDSLRKGAIPDYVRPLLPGEPSFIRYILKYECNCVVHIALLNLHKEIVLFANQRDDCFGILADDMDYLIFETKPLMSARNLDLNMMWTTVFLRKELLVLTGLKKEQLPLLACIAGNNIVCTKALSKLHNRLSPRYGNKDIYIVERILAFIRQYGWPSNHYRYLLSDIAEIMEIDRQNLEAGIDYYDLTKKLSSSEEISSSLKTVNILHSMCQTCRLPSSLYILFTLRRARYGISVEDPRDSTIPPSAVIFKSIRHRMYSIMFQGGDIEVKEWCVYKNKNFLDPELARCLPVDIDDDIPSFEDLVTGNVEIQLRWKLFVACLGISIPAEELARLDNHFVSMCSILNVLLHCEQLQLKKWEVKSFIYQAVFPYAKDTSHVSRLEVDIDPRAASLLGILVRGISILIKVLAVCGLPFPLQEAMPWKCIEGKVFHFCYNIFKESPDVFTVVENLSCNKAEAINAFQNMYRITTMGVSFAEEV